MTSSTHWPAVAAGTPGGIDVGHELPARHLGEQRSPETPVRETFISVDMQPVEGSPVVWGGGWGRGREGAGGKI